MASGYLLYTSADLTMSDIVEFARQLPASLRVTVRYMLLPQTWEQLPDALRAEVPSASVQILDEEAQTILKTNQVNISWHALRVSLRLIRQGDMGDFSLKPETLVEAGRTFPFTPRCYVLINELGSPESGDLAIAVAAQFALRWPAILDNDYGGEDYQAYTKEELIGMWQSWEHERSSS